MAVLITEQDFEDLTYAYMTKVRAEKGPRRTRADFLRSTAMDWYTRKSHLIPR